MSNVFPDSRPRERKGAIPGPGGMWVPIFCANCGRDGGLVPEKNMTGVYYVCDPCFEKLGPTTFGYVSTDQEFFRRVKEEMLEAYGRDLTPQELELVVQADSSPLATLLREGRKRIGG